MQRARIPEWLEAVPEPMSLPFDQADLLAILALRFGMVPQGVVRRIRAVTDVATLERLVQAAVRVEDWQAFMRELDAVLGHAWLGDAQDERPRGGLA
ncbi:hypothetical protein GCM10025857_17220 [Alicyclobacillus contaminans]|uniref:hypothetical protein n=1 Tax=Alicyclobacillus contaminans TaxID=392016 RepID=UPI00041778BE|nr:hypothetical protein [Alicyclobacillus contaminans]GMA50365.1 hypothetical protein GCM10025857_17220 [Alicyclobacillus contaminans]